jgi:hypothetical protein
MKNLKLIILTSIVYVGLITGCSVDRNILSENEKTEWTVMGDTIFRNNRPVAVYDHIEYELYSGKETIETSINQIDGNPENTLSLVRFVHYSHKKDKVEVVIKN